MRALLDVNASADYITHLIYRGLAAHPARDDTATELAAISERLARIEARLDRT